MKQSSLLVVLCSVVFPACSGEMGEQGLEGSVGQAEQAVTTQCASNLGVNPGKSALAVAMASELKRWEPLTDLVKIRSPYYGVALSSDAQAKCASSGGCPNTESILKLQDPSTNAYPNGIQNNVFNAVGFASDLYASWDRQYYLIQDLTRNNPGALPEKHVLATATAFTPNPAVVSCGKHYYFSAAKPDGRTALAKPANLINALQFFGGTANPFLQFIVSGSKVAVDADEWANSTPAPSSSCTAYFLDKLWDPALSLKGRCCTTQGGLRGALSPLSGNVKTEYCKPR